MGKNILLIALMGTLVACGTGSNNSSVNTNASDVQNGSTASGTGGNVGSISYVATNCIVIKPNGTCSLAITYSGTGSYLNSPLTIALPSNYTTNTTCPNAITTSQTCNLTINASNASTSTSQLATITLNNSVPPLLNLTVTLGGTIQQ